MKELLEEGALDPEKLFDEKKFNTIIVGKEGIVKKEAGPAGEIAVLLSQTSTREEKDEALKELKEKKATDLLIQAIKKAKTPEDAAILLAACWETGLDFSKHYAFFAETIAAGYYASALEAYTVLETTDSAVDEPELKKSLELLNAVKKKNNLVSDAIALITQKLHTT